MGMKANGTGFDPFTMQELGATGDFNSTAGSLLLDGLGGNGRGLGLDRQMTSI